jgi:hypothetical protein
MTLASTFAARSLLALLLALCLSRPAVAGGLRCSIGEVVIENLKIGQSYSLKTLANLPLSLTNTSDHAVRVSIDPMIPGVSELRQGAEAIPDLGWASATPETLEFAPNQTRAAELILTIPDDERLFGRKFQAIFWSHTLPREGDMLAYGLKSRVIFTIDREREEEGVHPTGDLSITLQPAQVQLGRVAPGRTYRLEEAAQEPLKIRNTSNHTVSVDLKALSSDQAGRSESGWADLLSAAQVVLEPSSFSLAPGEERTVGGTISLPKGRLKVKDFMCVISAAVTGMAVKTEIYSRIYVHAR